MWSNVLLESRVAIPNFGIRGLQFKSGNNRMATRKTITKRARKKTNSAAGGAKAATKRSSALTPRAAAAVKRAAEALWEAEASPHILLKELHEVMLLRCLKDADGNYAAAADRFGPSRQSVQQYANSPLRDARWRPYQQNRRKST